MLAQKCLPCQHFRSFRQPDEPKILCTSLLLIILFVLQCATGCGGGGGQTSTSAPLRCPHPRWRAYLRQQGSQQAGLP